jgi:prevent-host-death family protein
MPSITAAVNVNEAKTNFSAILAEVESRKATYTVMRYGHPVARIVPIERLRKIRPLPGYGGKIEIKADLFSDDSALWENA